MATFIPPVANITPPVLPTTRGVQRRLFRYFGPWPQGLSVVYRAGHYVTVPNPYWEELALLVDGVTYFLGGHTYTVTTAVGNALTADGYVVT